MGKYLTWVFVIILVVVLVVYASGTAKVTSAFGGATTGGIKALFGPGKYASGKA